MELSLFGVKIVSLYSTINSNFFYLLILYMEIIITAILGIALGFLIGILLMRNQKQKFIMQSEVLSAQIDNEKQLAQAASSYLQSRLEEVRQAADSRVEEVKSEARMQFEATMEAKERYFQETLTAQDRHHRESLVAQQARFDEIMARNMAELKSATDEMLKQRQKEFAESSNLNLGQIVNPLRETIDRMKQEIEKATHVQTAMSSTMKANIEQMMRQSEAAKQSTDELTRAFKHGSKVQGDWGETILDEILQSQGLTRGRHYDTQAVIRDAMGNIVRSEAGSIMRPDVIMHLDQRREVIIDSKVSLTAFMDLANAENEADRQLYLKAHVDSLQKHIKELSEKDYSAYIHPPKVKMDYVIMFVPNTGALWTALKAQPDMWRKAMEKNVFIADEQTLFAALRIINLTWTQIDQAQNHEKVFALANEMLDRVGQFMKKYQALGKALENASKAYEEGERKLQPQGQSILQTCAKLEKLGAKQNDRNPLPQISQLDEFPDLSLPE